MMSRRCVGFLLACSVAASIETAYAGPEECLTHRDNMSVAGCANRYAPATAGTIAPTTRRQAQAAHQPILSAEKWLLFPVPTAAAREFAPSREPPDIVVARDRSELIRRAELGAVGLAAMGLVFGVWRWRASMVKTCAFCGARVVPGAAVCKRCFRSV